MELPKGYVLLISHSAIQYKSLHGSPDRVPGAPRRENGPASISASLAQLGRLFLMDLPGSFVEEIKYLNSKCC